MNDEGSLDQAFLPDGTVNTKALGRTPKTSGSVPITLMEHAWWWAGSVDCPKPGQ